MSDVIVIRRDQIARAFGNDMTAVRAIEVLFDRVMNIHPDQMASVGSSADVALSSGAAAAAVAHVAAEAADTAESRAVAAMAAAQMAAAIEHAPAYFTSPATQALWDAIDQISVVAHAALVRQGSTQEFSSLPANPTVDDIAPGGFGLFKNTTSGLLTLWANDGGVMKSVTLT